MKRQLLFIILTVLLLFSCAKPVYTDFKLSSKKFVRVDSINLSQHFSEELFMPTLFGANQSYFCMMEYAYNCA